MHTGIEFLPTLAATTLGAVATMMVAGTSADAAPVDLPSRSFTACHALNGSYEEKSFGGWYCTHPALAELDERTLTSVCGTRPSAYLLDDGNPRGTVGFYCPPPLIS